ncbi:2-oxoacid:ferredoxin oxidoreductase subunit alpha [Candidatus Heimdallarchaeota archaeon B3_Heim]|nr:MAG: 2-oxoacid:ferredoxin oxidoreductase subunit alpha [Candidatus Heimdallarchaeota archaeon B3_Heim]
MAIEFSDSISIVLCGAAGQGIATVETLLTSALKKSGFHVFSTQEFMSRVRGGTNSTTIRVSTNRVQSYCEKIDILVPFTREAVSHVKNRLSSISCIIGNKKLFESNSDAQSCILVDVNYEAVAEEIGHRVYSNSVAVGVLAGLLQTDRQLIAGLMADRFQSKGEKIVNNNIEAVKRGCDLADEIMSSNQLPPLPSLINQPSVSSELYLSGRDAVALGAIAGGCNYVIFYPMAPSTGVGAFLARNRLKFGIVSDQTEDEISAINKAFGAWYAGARALVTTSGGGFALMTEGLSLAGVTEMPLIIHLGQRPGPATGMPTRTEQGDLELVLYSGHGDFPRVIYAPGTLKEAFLMTQQAFNIAAKYQVPVIILTDHYFINTSYNLPSLDYENTIVEKHLIETQSGYQRYQFTEDGISPRGIPGRGEGFIRVDSHTHTQNSQITEDPVIRKNMVDKMFKKLQQLKEVAIKPNFLGNSEDEVLVISWGSTFHNVKGAITELGKKGHSLSYLHFSQVYPIHRSTSDYLKKAKKIVMVENNATGQFAQQLYLEFGIKMTRKVLKYTGYPFSIEELVKELEKELK